MTTPAPETPSPTPLPDDRLPSPCPFCGTQLMGHGDGDDMWEHPFVGCHADCQVLFNAKDIAAWNRRVPPLPWFDLSSAPRDGTPIWGRVDQDARRMLWHAGFGAFVASWRRMSLADGMTFDDTGLSHKDHSPEIVNADAWMPMPGTEVRVPPPGEAALVEALRETLDAIDYFLGYEDDRDPFRTRREALIRLREAHTVGSSAAALSASPDDGRADAAGVGE